MPLDYAYRAKQALVACKMGNKNATQYADALYKQLVNCKDITEAEAKFIFETSMSNWLQALLLLCKCTILKETMLCTERIGSTQQSIEYILKIRERK